jgi:hypothetical protein
MNTLQDIYNEINDIITNATNETGKPFSYGKFEGIGWLEFTYTNSTYSGPFPKISLKLQKNAVHIYIMHWLDGKPIIENYVDAFGKSATGVGCIRIKKLTEERKTALEDIVNKILVATSI